MTTTHKVLVGILIIIVIALLARYVVFKEKFDEWGAGLQRIEDWQTEYKQKNPNASKEEMDAAFEAGMDNITEWKAEYKRDNPGATDAEADAAFSAMWNN
ncbi:MAG TPA: hypothetical protein VGE18_02730 [Candidatus Paceibacterota bacterium]